MKIKANQTIAHGAYNLQRGVEVEVPDSVAADLVKAGLVVEVGSKKAPAPENKMASQPENKAKK